MLQKYEVFNAQRNNCINAIQTLDCLFIFNIVPAYIQFVLIFDRLHHTYFALFILREKYSFEKVIAISVKSNINIPGKWLKIFQIPIYFVQEISKEDFNCVKFSNQKTNENGLLLTIQLNDFEMLEMLSI